MFEPEGCAVVDPPMGGSAASAVVSSDWMSLAAAAGWSEAADLDDGGLVDLVAATERLVSWVQSRQLRALAELARRRSSVPGGHGSGVEFGGDEVAAELRVSPGAGQARVGLAVDLCGRLTATLDALSRGRSTWCGPG